MDYQQAIDYIHGTHKFGSKLGLENMLNLLKRLGNPQTHFKSIHVAGTNGKGSVTSMLTNVLHQSGYRVGMFVSPYLENFTERIQVNLKEIPKDDLARLTGEVKKRVQEMVEEGNNHPTEFEIVTAIGFLYFAEQRVDYAVVEVGLGGRLDATNVLDPLVSVITSISYDHVDVLGDTLDKIAYEKAGIIKPGRWVVSYPQPIEAARMIRKVAHQKGAPLVEVSHSQVTQRISQIGEQVFDFCFEDYQLDNLIIHLSGKHQLINAATALTTLVVLRRLGISINEEAIRIGISNTMWPGRLEKLFDSPVVIIDGAHNVSGSMVLADEIKTHYKNKKIVLVFGILKDKDVNAVAQQLCPLADTVVVTRPDSPRAMEPEQLADMIKPLCSKVTVEPNIEQAVKLGLMTAGMEDVLIVSGSFYLIGKARRIIKDLIHNK